MKTTQSERDTWRKNVTRVSLTLDQELRLLDDADSAAALGANVQSASADLARAGERIREAEGQRDELREKLSACGWCGTKGSNARDFYGLCSMCHQRRAEMTHADFLAQLAAADLAVRKRVDCGSRAACEVSPPCSWHQQERIDAAEQRARDAGERLNALIFGGGCFRCKCEPETIGNCLACQIEDAIEALARTAGSDGK